MSQATGYFTHKECWRHEMGAGHPECPARLDAIEDRLRATGLGDVLDRREATAAALADLETAMKGDDKAQIEATALAHEAFVKQAAGAAPKKVIVVPGRLVNVVL